jgi:ATP-binding cassette subfamily B (MDR/TAP) protein 6
MITLNILNTLQNVIICGGLLAGSLLCVHMVVDKQGFTVGDYVLFASYIIQLYVPLNWFGTYYRAIQKCFVDMENMFDLMRETEEVFDAPGAGPLMLKRGDVEFKDVSFSYVPERVVLKNICFKVPSGTTTALVLLFSFDITFKVNFLGHFSDIKLHLLGWTQWQREEHTDSAIVPILRR